jgi:transposase
MSGAWHYFSFRRCYMSEYFVGGDVSKGFADWVVLDEDLGMVLKPFRLDDTMAGHRALQKRLRQVLAGDAQAEFIVGVEYTGGMEQNWVHGLRQVRDLPLRVARLNPRGVAQYVKGSLTRTITDGVSAEMIARYLHVHHPKISFNTPAHPLEPLRAQWTALCMLKKQRQQLSNMLQALLYTAMPSILCYCRHGFADWALSVVAAYPTAAQLSRARLATVAAIPRVTMQRATSLIEAAKTDVASRTDPSASQLIKTVVGHIRHLERGIQQAEHSLRQQAAGMAQVRLLESFIGIGYQKPV